MRRLVIAPLILIALALACSGEKKPTPTPTGEQPTSRGTTVRPIAPAATATPPVTAADVPIPQWSLVSASELPSGENYWSHVLLDVDSGQFYKLGSDPVAPDTYGGVSIRGWLPNGEALLQSTVIYNPPNKFLQLGALYAGKPLGPIRRLVDAYDSGSYSNAIALAADGLIAAAIAGRNLLIESTSGAVVGELPGPPAEIEAWSGDGQLLAMAVRENQTENLVVWNRLTKDQTEIKDVRFSSWSNHGHLLAYLRFRNDVTGYPFEIHVVDIDTGLEFAVGRGGGNVSWSPDDRFIGYEVSDGSYNLRIYDRDTSRPVLEFTAAGLGGWLDNDTLYFTGNECGTEVLYTINADGSDGRGVAQIDWPFASPLLSPDGDRIAYNRPFEDVSDRRIRVVVLATGQTAEFAVGATMLRGWWSPDGRYLVLAPPAGKDACMGTNASPETVVRRP